MTPLAALHLLVHLRVPRTLVPPGPRPAPRPLQEVDPAAVAERYMLGSRVEDLMEKVGDGRVLRRKGAFGWGDWEGA